MLDEKDNVSRLEEEIDSDDGIVQLINEDGEALDFFFVASLDYKGDWYAFFQPAEEMEDIDDDEIVIFKVVENEDGEDTFEPIEDEALLDEVYEEYVKLHQEYLENGGGCDDDCCCGHHHHDHDCDCDCDCEGECDDDCDCDCDKHCKCEE